MYDAIVVGAGISGLTAAFWLRQEKRQVLVLEKNEEVGGTMGSYGSGDFVFERGPNSILNNRELTSQLLNAAGMEEWIQPANATAKKRYLFRKGEIREVPNHPIRFFQSELMSKKGFLRMISEPFRPGASPQEEESLAAFMDRRIGAEAREVLVDAFVGGIYAGSTSALSAAAAFPTLVQAEKKYGSIVLGLLAGRAPNKPKTVPCSFKGGMQTLPRELARQVGDEHVLTSANVEKITALPEEGYEVRYLHDGLPKTARAHRVIMGTPAHNAAHLLSDLLPKKASQSLLDIPYASVVVAGLGLPSSAFPEGPPQGFGFLIPRNEDMRILGCIYASSLFPERAPKDHVALSVFVGGAHDSEAVTLPDEALQALVLADLKKALGITSPPVCFETYRWNHAIPQYTQGHLQRRECIEEALAEQPGLYCVGNYLRGISVHDAIASGYAAFQDIMEKSRGSSAP